MVWEMICDNVSLPLDKVLHGQVSFPSQMSGKSIIRPESFRNAQHEGQPLRTNGIVSTKTNSIHKFIPQPGLYNQSERAVMFSRNPSYDTHPCGSAEMGIRPCRETRHSHGLRHLRAYMAYRKPDLWSCEPGHGGPHDRMSKDHATVRGRRAVQ